MNNSLSQSKIWNIAGYSRLSRDDGDKEESDSIVNQKDLIKSFIKNKSDMALIKEYEDDGFSGVDFERPAFKRMIEDIRNGVINCVIVKDLSRLGRNYIETGKLLGRFFPFMGVRFIAVNDSYDSQSHNAQTDNLIIPFKNLINDAYCADISKKIRSQFEIRRKNGDFIGSFAVYGYMKDPERRNCLKIDDETACTVRDIFAWKINGMNQQSIADKLNGLGILSPLEYKKACGSNYVTVFDVNARAKWTAVAVSRILKNDIYTGVLTQGVTTTPNYKVKQRIKKVKEEWVRVENAHEAIISPSDFALAARLLNKDTRTTPGGNEVYIFSGLLHCGDCGRSLVRKPVKNIEYAYFVCSTYKKDKSCQSHNISEKVIYDAVSEVLTHHIRRCVELSNVISAIEDMPLHRAETLKLQKQMAQKQEELEKIARRKVRLYEDYADGVMDREEYERFKRTFEAQSVEANRESNSLADEISKITSGDDTKMVWIEHFKKYHELHNINRTAVAELIERIDIYEDKRLKITIRYYDEFEAAISYLESMPDYILERTVV